MSLQTLSFRTIISKALIGVGLLAGSLVILVGGCRDQSADQPLPTTVAPASSPDQTASDPAASTASSETVSETTPAAAPPEPEPVASEFYAQGVNRASSAYNFSQTARSPDEWRLVASRWQQAIDLLESVPEGDPNRANAQQKIGEYQRNFQYAQQQAEQIIAASQAPITVPSSNSRTAQPTPQAAPTAANSTQPTSRVHQVPILRRLSGTPVVPVNFNGQRYDMILDTGASGTLITPSMANSLNIIPIGRTRVATASSSSVTFSVGIIDVIQVGGIVETDVQVAIAGPELEVGLLGHDVFGDFDITIRQNTVEFHSR